MKFIIEGWIREAKNNTVDYFTLKQGDLFIFVADELNDVFLRVPGDCVCLSNPNKRETDDWASDEVYVLEQHKPFLMRLKMP